MKKYLLVSLLFLAGCQSMTRQSNLVRQAEQSKIKDTIPICSSDKECQKKWDAAQVWVSKNADYKIQTSSSAIIETYDAPGGSRDLSMKVLKEPLGNDKYQMVISVQCANWILGCEKDTMQTMQTFNDYINEIK